MKALSTSTRRYYKYQSSEKNWTQPVLSANGTLGGNSFAVEASTTLSGNPAWKAFDGDTSTPWNAAANTVTGYIILYHPTGIKISEIACYRSASSSTSNYPTAGAVYRSNDNSSWTKLCDWNNGVSNAWYTINVNSNNFYKYYRLNITTSNITWAYATGWNEIQITATIPTTIVVEGTSSDYDFYEDVSTFYTPKKTVNSVETFYAANL